MWKTKLLDLAIGSRRCGGQASETGVACLRRELLGSMSLELLAKWNGRQVLFVMELQMSITTDLSQVIPGH